MDDIIAIDGPAGSGKSTVAKLLAKRLAYLYIDTGAMYRALTLKALKRHTDLKNEGKLSKLARETTIDIINDSSGNIKVMLDNEDVTMFIRTPKLTNSVTYIAKVNGVREKMVENQRKIGMRGRCVFEGRDIGTVVFPEAKYKFYLDAEFKERVKRRYDELIQTACKVSYDKMTKDIAARDRNDMARQAGPLKKADDAVYIDTTNMTVVEVVDKLIRCIK